MKTGPRGLARPTLFGANNVRTAGKPPGPNPRLRAVAAVPAANGETAPARKAKSAERTGPTPPGHLGSPASAPTPDPTVPSLLNHSPYPSSWTLVDRFGHGCGEHEVRRDPA